MVYIKAVKFAVYMKKIDKIFNEFPELKFIEVWFRNEIENKSSKHPIKNVYRGYSIRKPKKIDEAIDILKNSSDFYDQLWARMYIDHYYWGNALLGYLNKIFNNLKDLQGFSNFITNLKNAEQFWDTISEMEFNAYFNKRFSTTLEPKIFYEPDKHKKLDSKIKIDQRDILFEIITPRMIEKTTSEKAEWIKNRAKDKLLDKLDKQIKPLEEVITEPLIIVINGSYSELDKILVKDALLGQSQFTVEKDKTTKEVVDIYLSRAKNALKNSRQQASIISAVLMYKRIIHSLGIEFSTELILNENSNYPLSSTEYNRLRRFNITKIK